MDTRNAYRTLLEKPLGKRTLKNLRAASGYNIVGFLIGKRITIYISAAQPNFMQSVEMCEYPVFQL
jgi:hypothetical protein